MYGMVGRQGMQAFASSLQITSSKDGRRAVDDETSCHTPAKAARPGGQLGGDPAFGGGDAAARMAAVVANRAYAEGRTGTTINALSSASATFDAESNAADSGQAAGRKGNLAFSAVLSVVSMATAAFVSVSMGMGDLPLRLRQDAEYGNGFGTLGLLGVKHLDYLSGSTWPDSAGNYAPSGWMPPPPPPPPSPPPVCPYETECCGVDSAGEWTIRDCDGVCAPPTFWGDGTCDFRFACEQLQLDMGDCQFADEHGNLPPIPSPPPSPSPSPSQTRVPPPPAPAPTPAPPAIGTPPTPPPPAPPSIDVPPPLPTVCVDRYTNCAGIVAQYTCETDLSTIAPSNPHELLSYACCGTCTGNGLIFQNPEPEPEPDPSEPYIPAAGGVGCEYLDNSAFQGTQLSLILMSEHSTCCDLCSQNPECMGWTHLAGQCTLFSAIDETVMSRRGAKANRNHCWGVMRDVYARCCEDVGVDCDSVFPATCSDQCNDAADSFFDDCQPFVFSHSPHVLGNLLNQCRTHTHSLPGCTDTDALNFNAMATTDDGSCLNVHRPPATGMQPATPGQFPGCPYVYCCGGDSSGWHALDCYGQCMPIAAIFNNVCDDSFNCEVYQNDRGHCTPAAPAPPPPPGLPDGQFCSIDADHEVNCPRFVTHCSTLDIRQRCPMSCAFGSYAPQCADPCRCTVNSLSGLDTVPGTGCAYFSATMDPICFVADPENCEAGLPSSQLQLQVDTHVEWRYCDPTTEGGLATSCFDGVQNGDEACIDGGGSSCPPCSCPPGDVACLCHDGMLSPGEQMADCGGPCNPCECTFRVVGTGWPAITGGSPFSIDGEYAQVSGTNTFQMNSANFDINVTWSAGLWIVTTTGAGEVYSRAGGSGLPPSCGWRRMPYEQVVQSALPAFGPCDGDAPQCSACIDGNGDAACGGPCDPCPTCWDGIRNQGETGVDCGGPCDACAPLCSDGLQNGGEESIDCGGVCGSCPTCHDGIQNQGELGVDCGGPCADTCGACQCTTTGRSAGVDVGFAGCGTWQNSADPICYVVDPANCPAMKASRSHPGTGWRFCDPQTGGMVSCNDGYQGAGETGIDCGGPCESCPTCLDGAMNGDEDQTDCGGPDCRPCATTCPQGQRFASASMSCIPQDEWCTLQWGPSWFEAILGVCVCNTGYSPAGHQGQCVPSQCADGVLSPGEDGLDCGGPCDPCDPCACTTTGLSGAVLTPIGCAHHDRSYNWCYVLLPDQCVMANPIATGGQAGAAWRSCIPGVDGAQGR